MWTWELCRKDVRVWGICGNSLFREFSFSNKSTPVRSFLALFPLDWCCTWAPLTLVPSPMATPCLGPLEYFTHVQGAGVPSQRTVLLPLAVQEGLVERVLLQASLTPQALMPQAASSLYLCASSRGVPSKAGLATSQRLCSPRILCIACA